MDLRVDLRVARRADFSAILRVGRGAYVARPACEGLPSRQNCLTSRTILPIGLFLRLAFHCGEVAQLGEHRLRKAGVEGSNPFFSTTISRGYLITGNPFLFVPTPLPVRLLKNMHHRHCARITHNDDDAFLSADGKNFSSETRTKRVLVARIMDAVKLCVTGQY